MRPGTARGTFSSGFLGDHATTEVMQMQAKMRAKAYQSDCLCLKSHLNSSKEPVGSTPTSSGVQATLPHRLCPSQCGELPDALHLSPTACLPWPMTITVHDNHEPSPRTATPSPGPAVENAVHRHLDFIHGFPSDHVGGMQVVALRHHAIGHDPATDARLTDGDLSGQGTSRCH